MIYKYIPDITIYFPILPTMLLPRGAGRQTSGNLEALFGMPWHGEGLWSLKAIMRSGISRSSTSLRTFSQVGDPKRQECGTRSSSFGDQCFYVTCIYKALEFSKL